MNNKILKKFSIFMSCLFIFMAVSMPVFAATPTIDGKSPSEGSITITKTGATFTAYEILSATQSGDAYEYAPTNEFNNFFDNSTYGNYDAKTIQNLSADDIPQFAVDLHKYVLDNNIKGITLTDGQATNVPLGYYLVSETASDSDDHTAVVASTPILVSVPQVSGDTWDYNPTIKPKDNTPTLEKNIIENGQKVKTSSANIGDVINYEVNSAIPIYESNATKIKYTFTDTMSKGLTYDSKKGFTVTSGDKKFEEGTDYTVSTSTNSTGQTIITIDFVYDSIKAYAATGLTLKYQALLNKNALINTAANAGNPNDISLEYTNNPNIKENYNHLKDHVTTYTWGFALKKVDAANNNTPLANATFILSGNNITDKTISTDINGFASLNGLKEGTYTLTETNSPKGYKKLKTPITLTITANKNDDGSYNGAATINITKVISGNTVIAQQIDNYSSNENTLFNVQVVNFAGFSLPSTGGIGTNGFLRIAIMLLGVVCVLGLLGLGYTKLEGKKNSRN